MRRYNLMRRDLIQYRKDYQHLLCQGINLKPDITGTEDSHAALYNNLAKPVTGVFSWVANHNNRIGSNGGNYGGILTFKSSGSSSLFGKSSTIQPQTFYILMIIKI